MASKASGPPRRWPPRRCARPPAPRTPTAECAQLQRRIEKAVDAIVAAGTVAFVLQPEMAARFQALMPSDGKGARKKSDSTATPA
ncbi:MAG: hypothetical protein AB1730_03680 [Myxococcota bacterium]|jgi:hypothetical protein